MALNLDAVGKTTEPISFDYNWTDVARYALGIGAKRDELDYLYEGRGPKVYPTYSVVPAWQVMLRIFDIVGGDLLGIVHGGQKITVHRPFAPTDTLTTVGKIDAIYDLKRLAQGIFSTQTHNGQGELLCKTEWHVIYRFDGDFGGERPPRIPKADAPERSPDFEVVESIPEEQALLYRLSGDYNPLHADPETSQKAGFELPILHGLCTYGYVARAVVQKLCGGDADQLHELCGQFRSPVWPGETLITRGWREENRVLLQAHTQERPEERPFTNAYAHIKDI